MQHLKLERYFEDFRTTPPRSIAKQRKNYNLQFKNRSIANDLNQMRAVKSVLSEDCFPFPFVICGGPGTGKTTVMIECVLQILQHKPNSHILITTQSNSACDEIGVRLLQYVQAHQLFRYFSQSQAKSNKDKNTEELRKSSTIANGSFKHPTNEEFYSYKIVIVTMVTCNRLVMNKFGRKHFNFIFVDECCAAMEPECLIPIVGLGMEHEKVNASIVLVGDPKLLGPKVDSNQATAMNLGKKYSSLRHLLHN
jgi:helicase MOV-10